MKGIFFIILVFILTTSLVHTQVFIEIEGEDKSELRGTNIRGGCPIPILPEYPGGIDSLHAFLNRNLTLPKPDTCQEEKIWIVFTIDSTGQVVDISSVRGGCKAYIDEAIRVFSIMPKWIPGKSSGKPTKVQYRLPIIFKKE